MIVRNIKLRNENTKITLTTYVIDDSTEMLNGKKRPAILICPGGGYLYCSDREGEPIALSMAAMGYHAFVLRYSSYYDDLSKMSFENGIEPKPVSAHPAPVLDIALAMKCIHEHSNEWLVDTERIAICGFSAGSHNCAMYSVYWNKPLITDYIGVKKGLRPAAAILSYGVSDNTIRPGEMPAILDLPLENAYKIALFGNDNPSDEDRIAVSPALLVDADTPPTFLWTTTADGLVPPEQTILMAEGLAKHQIPFEMHIFESGSHGLALAKQSTAAARSNIMPDVAVWISLAETWLQKRFALPLPEYTIWDKPLTD